MLVAFAEKNDLEVSLICNVTIKYGNVTSKYLEKYDGNVEKASKEFFGIYNKQDTYDACEISCVWIEGNDPDRRDRGFMIHWRVPWEPEHGLTFGVTEKKITHIE